MAGWVERGLEREERGGRDEREEKVYYPIKMKIED